MTLSWTNDSSVFEDGKPRPGIYEIQNIVGQTYVGTWEHPRDLCGRPATVPYLPGLDTPYAGYGVETLSASTGIYLTGQHSLNQGSRSGSYHTR
ncbi:hypothetical protein BDM02DRAFT_3113171 [Thelephora ganbajun]|uniref:Uncharacterized protein n=1 Tax=Thelephora ganbajun TaxID=370292 RepID=A0ACB6ZJL8_THEGA|nr:hypothetical protein BDM02DRAFT_3113171 [Thelephora ganbajun]